MKLTIIQPAMGKQAGKPYIRSWQMEPLAPAVLAGLTPKEIEIKFYDDRMEEIFYNDPTDLVAITVETYTAKRAYQIASEYKKRKIPVVMGGFHPTLIPEETLEYAEAIVVGEAEGVWQKLIEDFCKGKLQRVYNGDFAGTLQGVKPDRSIFSRKNYLPIALIETGRGCIFKCEFCAVQSFFQSSYRRRPVKEVIEEIQNNKKPLYFFVDDNIASNFKDAKDFFKALIPLKIRWISQASINIAYDIELLNLLKESGCQGLLIGFESLNSENLKQMHKTFNTIKGGYETALFNLYHYGIRLYPTFIFGYDGDTKESFDEVLKFTRKHKFYIAAFNHLTPFPGTGLYKRLEKEERLLFNKWWLDDNYYYGMIPFVPKNISANEVKKYSINTRARFYSFHSIVKRSLDFKVNSRSLFMWLNFFIINILMRKEVFQRKNFPLGAKNGNNF